MASGPACTDDHVAEASSCGYGTPLSVDSVIRAAGTPAAGRPDRAAAGWHADGASRSLHGGEVDAPPGPGKLHCLPPEVGIPVDVRHHQIVRRDPGPAAGPRGWASVHPAGRRRGMQDGALPASRPPVHARGRADTTPRWCTPEPWAPRRRLSRQGCDPHRPRRPADSR